MYQEYIGQNNEKLITIYLKYITFNQYLRKKHNGNWEKKVTSL
jgi:Tfp pilus assembly protein PilP